MYMIHEEGSIGARDSQPREADVRHCYSTPRLIPQLVNSKRTNNTTTLWTYMILRWELSSFCAAGILAPVVVCSATPSPLPATWVKKTQVVIFCHKRCSFSKRFALILKKNLQKSALFNYDNVMPGANHRQWLYKNNHRDFF